MAERARVHFIEDLGGLELIEAAHDRPSFPRHAHPTYAVGEVHRGQNRFRYRGGAHVAPAGAVCTVTPDEVHTVEPAGEGFAYRCIYPPAALLRAAAEAATQARVRVTLVLPAVVDDPATAGLATAAIDAICAAAPPLAREQALARLLTRLVTVHATRPVPVRPAGVPGGAMERARDFLAAQVARNLSLGVVAGVAGMEPFAFLRAFARTYGLPPHAWVVQLRVRRAQELLRAGRAPAEVAAALGFSDQSHLTRHFRRVTGVTPGAYRRARWGPDGLSGG